MAERQGMNNGTNSTASLPNSSLNSLSAPLSREANRAFRLFDICSPISHSFKSHQVAHNTAAEDRLAVTPLGGFSASKIFDLTRLRHFLPTVTNPSNFFHRDTSFASAIMCASHSSSSNSGSIKNTGRLCR